MVRDGVSSRTEALDYISELTGEEYSIALQAVDEHFPSYLNSTSADIKKVIKNNVKNSAYPESAARAMLREMEQSGQISSATRNALESWIEKGMN